MRQHRPVFASLDRLAAALLGFLLLVLGTAVAANQADEDNMIVVKHRFGDQTGPTSVGFESYTEIEPGRRFMYVNQSSFQSFLSGYATTYTVQFPGSGACQRL